MPLIRFGNHEEVKMSEFCATYEVYICYFVIKITFRCMLQWLGLMKRCPRTISVINVFKMNTLLTKYNETMPIEIHRYIRSLNVVKFWKATEFRTIILYVGMVLFKDFLPREEYNNFLVLCCAITICSTNVYKSFIPKAKELFYQYIETYININGIHSVTSNIHNLCHVADDVECFGELGSISAYPFENALYQLKLRLKKCDKPLEQISRRLEELSQTIIPYSFDKNKYIPELKCKFVLSEAPHLQTFHQIHYSSTAMLSNVKKNCWFLTQNDKIVHFKYAVYKNEKYFICGQPLKTTTNFFEQPFRSCYLNIYISDCEPLEAQFYELNSIQAKLFALPYADKYVFIPLIHTLVAKN